MCLNRYILFGCKKKEILSFTATCMGVFSTPNQFQLSGHQVGVLQFNSDTNYLGVSTEPTG